MIRKFCVCFSLFLMVMLSSCGRNNTQDKELFDNKNEISEATNSSQIQSEYKEDEKAAKETGPEEESGIFSFVDCFLITGRGLVVVGKAKDSINVGDFVMLETADGLYPAKVIGIEQRRKLLSSVNKEDPEAGILLSGIVAEDMRSKIGESRTGSLFRYDAAKVQTDYLETKNAGELGLKEDNDLESFTTKDGMKISFHKLSPSSFVNSNYDAETMEIDTLYMYSPDGNQIDLDSETSISFQLLTANPEEWEKFTETYKKAYHGMEEFRFQTINRNGLDYLVVGESKDYYCEFAYAMDLKYSVLLTISKEETNEEQRERAICEFHHMIKTMEFDTSQRVLY